MRVNCIDVKFLTDQHLVAEYREMKMATYYYVRSSKSKNGIDKSRISERYTLNGGHAYMWFDKFGYISKRFDALCEEMKRRGNQCNYDKLNFSGIPPEAFGDWTPTKEDVRVCLDRVLERIAKQPAWYSYMKGRHTMESWKYLYENWYNENKLICSVQ